MLESPKRGKKAGESESEQAIEQRERLTIAIRRENKEKNVDKGPTEREEKRGSQRVICSLEKRKSWQGL